MLPAIAALAFAAVALTVWGLLRPREDPVRRRLTVSDYRQTTRERRVEGSAGRRIVLPAFATVGRAISKLLPQNFVRSIDRMLMMGNMSIPLPAFLAFWALMVCVGLLTPFFLARSSLGITGSRLLLVFLVIIPYFILGPYIILRRRVKRRQKRIIRDLPYALDLLVTCVEAGMGVDAAFVSVTEKTTGPLSETFSLYLREVGLGRSRREALVSVAERTGVPDLIRIASAVAQAEEMGTTMGDVLRTQSADLRAVRKQRAQEAAQRAPVWMTIPLVLCFMPAMAAVIVVPSILNLLQFVSGALPAR